MWFIKHVKFTKMLSEIHTTNIFEYFWHINLWNEIEKYAQYTRKGNRTIYKEQPTHAVSAHSYLAHFLVNLYSIWELKKRSYLRNFWTFYEMNITTNSSTIYMKRTQSLRNKVYRRNNRPMQFTTFFVCGAFNPETVGD